jgi:hypothetical protein
VRSWGLSVLEQEELWRRWRQRESWPATAAAPAIELNALTRPPSGVPPDQAVQAGRGPSAAGSRGGQAGRALVTGADRALAPGHLSPRPTMRISHEPIYLSLYVPHRGTLRRDLRRCLGCGRARRHPRGKRLAPGRGHSQAPQAAVSLADLDQGREAEHARFTLIAGCRCAAAIGAALARAGTRTPTAWCATTCPGR